MVRPVRLDDAERAALAAAVRPVDRAILLTEIAESRGLDRTLAAMRDAALAAEVDEGRKVVWLAAKLGRSPSLISKLVSRFRAKEAAA